MLELAAAYLSDPEEEGDDEDDDGCVASGGGDGGGDGGGSDLALDSGSAAFALTGAVDFAALTRKAIANMRRRTERIEAGEAGEADPQLESGDHGGDPVALALEAPGVGGGREDVDGGGSVYAAREEEDGEIGEEGRTAAIHQNRASHGAHSRKVDKLLKMTKVRRHGTHG